MLSNAYETIQVISQKNTRIQKKVSLIVVYELFVVQFSFLKCCVVNLFFYSCVVKAVGWKNWFLSIESKVLFSVQLMRVKIRGLLLFENDYTVMNCTESIIWALNSKIAGVFWQIFFCQKMSFNCRVQTLKCQFTKTCQNSFSRWYIEGRMDQTKRKALAFSQVWRTSFPSSAPLLRALQRALILSRGVQPLWTFSGGFVTELCFVFSGKVVDCIRIHSETDFETRWSLVKQNSNFSVSLPCYSLSSAEFNAKGNEK